MEERLQDRETREGGVNSALSREAHSPYSDTPIAILMEGRVDNLTGLNLGRYH